MKFLKSFICSCLLLPSATFAAVVGLEGMYLGDSHVARVYAGPNLTSYSRLILFGVVDSYKENYGQTGSETNRYKVEGAGAAIQLLPLGTQFYFELNAMASKVSMQVISTPLSRTLYTDPEAWVGAAVGYDFQLSSQMYLNTVLGFSTPLKGFDLQGDNPALECSGVAYNRFCVDKYDFQTQLRIGVSYRF